jgi:hypothetical protein
MAQIEVKGIDRDGESRSMPVDVREALPAVALAMKLHDDGWKYALMTHDGRVVGGVRFDAKVMRRIWWVSS